MRWFVKLVKLFSRVRTHAYLFKLSEFFMSGSATLFFSQVHA